MEIHYQIFKSFLVVVILISLSTYLILYPPVEKNKRLRIDTQKKVMRIFAVVLLIFSLYGFFPLIKDILIYLKKGDSYIKKSECIVRNVSTMPIFFFAKKEIFCKDGKRFRVFFTLNNYFKNEKFIFNYLPHSKVIVGEKILFSPFLKRIGKN